MKRPKGSLGLEALNSPQELQVKLTVGSKLINFLIDLTLVKFSPEKFDRVPSKMLEIYRVHEKAQKSTQSSFPQDLKKIPKIAVILPQMGTQHRGTCPTPRTEKETSLNTPIARNLR